MENEEMDRKIWALIDQSAASQDLSEIRKWVESNKDCQQRYEELLRLHQELANIPVDQPSMRFTQNVWEEVEQLHTPFSAQSYINMGVVKGIAALFFIIIAGAILYGIATTGISFLAVENVRKANFTVDLSANTIQLFIFGNILLILLFFEKISQHIFRKNHHEH
jgi:anti-sigma factor RsiW